MAATYNITVQRGNTETLAFRLKDSEEAAFDLTGSVLIFRAATRTGDIVIRKDTDDGIAVDDPTSGEFTVALTPEETRSVPEGSLMNYELERRIDGNERTLVMGRLIGRGGVNDDG